MAAIIAVVALDLLLLGWIIIGRVRGRDPSRPELQAAVTLTGVTLASIVVLMPVMPFVAVAIIVAGMLAATWAVRGEWASAGWFVMGAGSSWLLYEAWAGLNDLTDAAVSRPDWSPLPLAVAVAASAAGATLILAERRLASSR